MGKPAKTLTTLFEARSKHALIIFDPGYIKAECGKGRVAEGLSKYFAGQYLAGCGGTHNTVSDMRSRYEQALDSRPGVDNRSFTVISLVVTFCGCSVGDRGVSVYIISDVMRDAAQIAGVRKTFVIPVLK